jgi:hypothetical protein
MAWTSREEVESGNRCKRRVGSYPTSTSSISGNLVQRSVRVPCMSSRSDACGYLSPVSPGDEVLESESGGEEKSTDITACAMCG